MTDKQIGDDDLDRRTTNIGCEFAPPGSPWWYRLREHLRKADTLIAAFKGSKP